MPSLTDTIHLDMLSSQKREGQLYGAQWGNPQIVPHLRYVRDQYVLPYLNPDHHAVEIGPGGGRWTRYLVAFEKLYVIDYHQELLDELTRSFRLPSLVCIRNNGTDFPSVPAGSIHFLFSFGVFVHLDVDLIRGYLANMKPLLRPEANVVLQYSDKTKEAARRSKGFSENTPDMMRAMVSDAGFVILEENLTLLPHSSIMRFARADCGYRASRSSVMAPARQPPRSRDIGGRLLRRIRRTLRRRP